MRTMVRKRYTAEFKAQAVELVRLGKTVPEVAEELGIGEGSLYRWVGPQEPFGSEGPRAVGEVPAADELLRLRREIAQLKLENDILKKGGRYSGNQTPAATRAMITQIVEATGGSVRLVCWVL